MRLFFALWPDVLTRARIAAAAEVLRLTGMARPVTPENFHLTLAFIGEASLAKLAALQRIGDALRAAKFTIRIDAYEYWAKPQIVVASAFAAPAALRDLWMRLHRELEFLPAALRPHVTLARKVAQAPVLPAMSPLFWSARSFSLVRSDTGAPQSVYTVVDTWPLLDEPPKE